MTTQLSMTRGDDVTFDVDVVDEDGAPVDITGFTDLWFTAKRRISDADEDAVISKSLGLGVEFDDTINSRANVTIEDTDTNDLSDRQVRLLWDVQASDGAVYRVHQDKRSGQWFLDGYYD